MNLIKKLHMAIDDARMMNFMRVNCEDLYNIIAYPFKEKGMDTKESYNVLFKRLGIEIDVEKIINDQIELRETDEALSNIILTEEEKIKRKYALISGLIDGSVTHDDIVKRIIDPLNGDIADEDCDNAEEAKPA